VEGFTLAQGADQMLEIFVAGPDLPFVYHAYALGESFQRVRPIKNTPRSAAKGVDYTLWLRTLQEQLEGSDLSPSRVSISRSEAQNSRRNWNAIIRGVLSPPKPTPSNPVGGDVLNVIAPKPVSVEGFPGIPANTMLGSAKFGWLNTLKN